MVSLISDFSRFWDAVSILEVIIYLYFYSHSKYIYTCMYKSRQE